MVQSFGRRVQAPPSGWAAPGSRRGAGGKRQHRPEESAECAAPLARRGPGPLRTWRGWISERRARAARGGGWDAAGRPPEHPRWPVARRPAGATRGCSWAGTRCGRRPRCWSPPCCWAPHSASASASASGSAAAPPARVRRTRWVGRAGNRGVGRGVAVFLGPVVRVSSPLLRVHLSVILGIARKRSCPGGFPFCSGGRLETVTSEGAGQVTEGLWLGVAPKCLLHLTTLCDLS